MKVDGKVDEEVDPEKMTQKEFEWWRKSKGVFKYFGSVDKNGNFSVTVEMTA